MAIILLVQPWDAAVNQQKLYYYIPHHAPAFLFSVADFCLANFFFFILSIASCGGLGQRTSLCGCGTNGLQLFQSLTCLISFIPGTFNLSKVYDDKVKFHSFIAFIWLYQSVALSSMNRLDIIVVGSFLSTA
jgi:hypothetical protein